MVLRTLTFEDINDKVEAVRKALDLVKPSDSADQYVLVSVHLGHEVTVTRKILPVNSH